LRIHRPRATAVGLLTICVGCATFFAPQFTTPHYRPTDDQLSTSPDAAALCANATTPPPCDGRHGDAGGGHLSLSSHSYYVYLPVFMASRLLVGMGSSPIISIGVTYIDDCSSTQKFATYAGKYTLTVPSTQPCIPPGSL